MALMSPARLRFPPLSKRTMADLVTKANHLGIAPEDYAKHLIEVGLALERKAEKSSFAKIMRPVRRAAGKVSDEEIVALVEIARRTSPRAASRRKKR